jgi:VWFA-related protein
MARTPSRLVLSLLLAAVSSASALAQQPQAGPQAAPDASTLTLKVTSPLTVENVTVTDAAGKPVYGLKQSDFTVKEDGKPQAIKNFEEYGTETPSKESAPPTLPPNAFTNAQPQATGAVNILLFDDVTVGLEDVMFERLQSLKYLKTIPPGAQVAIFKLTNGLRIVQGFTSDQNVLRAAIDSLQPELIPLTLGSSIQSGGSGIPPAQFGGGSPAQPGDGPPEQFAGERCRIMNHESEMTTAALDAVAAFASGIEGRKNLIWFTGGIPWLTDYPLFSRNPCLRDYTLQLHRAYGLLTAAQVAVYPVTLGPGLPGESTLDIANATGGVAYSGRNYLDVALREAIVTGSDYYSLSYVPPLSKYDGKYHTIEVKTDRPGLHLSYREGYTALDLAKPLPEKEAAKDTPAPDSEFHTAVDHGMIPSTQLLFEVRVTPSTTPAKPGDPPAGMLNPKLNGRRLVRYQFLYAVPPTEITLAPESNGTRKGSVELDTVAYGEDGVKVNVVRETVNLTVKPDQLAQFMQRPLYVPVQLDLPPGKIDLHAGVLDVPSQKIGTLELTETVTGK